MNKPYLFFFLMNQRFTDTALLIIRVCSEELEMPAVVLEPGTESFVRVGRVFGQELEEN